MFTPTTTPAHALAGAGLALATGLALAAPVQAAPPIRSLGEQQVAQQVREAARTASDNRIKQRSTPPGRATPTTDALDAALRGVVAAGAIGVTARLETPDLDWRGAAGLRDKDGAAPAQPQDRFRIASQTKLMVATLVLQEVEKGTWRLDQPVEEVVPGLFPGHAYVTFRQLLSHTSGAPNGTNEIFMAGGDFFSDYTAQQHIDLMNAAPWNPPGTPLYFNGGYVALGLLLEEENGRSVEDLRLVRAGRLRPRLLPRLRGCGQHHGRPRRVPRRAAGRTPRRPRPGRGDAHDARGGGRPAPRPRRPVGAGGVHPRRADVAARAHRGHLRDAQRDAVVDGRQPPAVGGRDGPRHLLGGAALDDHAGPDPAHGGHLLTVDAAGVRPARP